MASGEVGVETGFKTDSKGLGRWDLSKDLKVSCQCNGCLGGENSRQRNRERTVSGLCLRTSKEGSVTELNEWGEERVESEFIENQMGTRWARAMCRCSNFGVYSESDGHHCRVWSRGGMWFEWCFIEAKKETPRLLGWMSQRLETLCFLENNSLHHAGTVGKWTAARSSRPPLPQPPHPNPKPGA